ncbi:YdcF family protein [Qipengyuania thermophila]|uniref:YdcF family protein n=1 Tax=Qipengyuania thermophila TaxID=2509361 RepID=UPI0026D25542|nr:YdcF family protein [Qipengyuania thermophila]
MIRFLAALLLLYVGGFIWQAAFPPQPAPVAERTDAALVLTGGPGRIERGLAVVNAGAAREVFVSGVARQVTEQEFADRYRIAAPLRRCCVTLGYAAVDTRSNAREAAQWVEESGHRSVRLITADYHMRRAAGEVADVMPPGVTILRDAVRTRPSLGTMFAEYNKLVASLVWRLLPW